MEIEQQIEEVINNNKLDNTEKIEVIMSLINSTQNLTKIILENQVKDYIAMNLFDKE